jgi:hypothetical protein
MAKPMRLGLVLEGKDAEEFWKKEASQEFTPEQIEWFKEAKRIYKKYSFGKY